jgi:hypothetical protein
MRAHSLVAAVLCGLAATPPAQAAETALFGDAQAVSADDLGAKRGGTETSAISGSLIQGNDSSLSGTNTGNVSVGGSAAKSSGTIAPATVTGNHGITAVMQNTGDLVNMNNATSVNVYMR